MAIHSHNANKRSRMSTLKASRKEISALQKQERPRKKMKYASAADTVYSLTEGGISKFDKGEHAEAEDCFSQALSHNEMNSPSFYIRTSMEKSGEPRAQHKTVRFENSNDSRIEQSSSRPNMLFTSQRHEYNEGMHIYDRPFSIRSSKDREVVSSTLYYNIALTHVKRDHHQIAAMWFERVLIQITAKPNTELEAMTRHNLGHCFYRLGDAQRALQHYEKALSAASEGSEDALPNHLAVAKNCVGVLYCYQHKTAEAIALLEHSLELHRTCSGSRSSEAATILNNLGSAYYLRKSYEKALNCYKQSLSLRKTLLGKDSIEVAATVFNIGLTCHRIGHLDESLRCYQDFLDIGEVFLGTESKDVAIAYTRMAEIQSERRELQPAIGLFKNALQAGRASMGNYHPEVASILNRLGNLYCETRDLDSAMQYYQEGLKTERAIWPCSHPHIIITVTNIAHIHKHEGNLDDALRNFLLVRNIQTESLELNHIDLAETHTSIGLMQYRLGDFEDSFDSYQEALRIRRDHYETDEHLDVASTFNSVGLVAFKLGLFEVAKTCITQSLNILKKIGGADSRDLAILWYNIATIYFETGESEDTAINYYKETLRIERQSLGNDHPDVVLTMLHMGQKHQKVGDVAEALAYFTDALGIERRRGQNKNVAVGKILNLIGNVHLQQGGIAKMMECYVEASRIFESTPDARATLLIAGYNFYGLSKIHPCCAAVA